MYDMLNPHSLAVQKAELQSLNLDREITPDLGHMVLLSNLFLSRIYGL